MLKGKILVGEENADQSMRDQRWYQDGMAKVHNHDALWAFMIRLSDQMREDDFKQGMMKDPVLWRLLKMGVWDWRGEDVLLNQTVPAVRHATALASRMLPRLFKLEKKVGLVSSVDDKPINQSLVAR